ncbi:MAG TPA: S8 family serine peptidase [Terriglobales bacterium]|nr:S8 family serine peptidase [Terriglobales bacterium]
MKASIAVSLVAGVALSLGAYLLPGSVQAADQIKINGFTIVVPDSSIPRPGRINTNYFWAIPPEPNTTGGPPPGTETPGSVACVYQLVKGPKGCPIATSTKVPTGGWGAIAIIDAGYYPTAKSDLDTFSKYFGIPKADFTVVYADGHRPPSYGEWLPEEALDIEWAHAMAPKAKLFLVESKLCDSGSCNTDPTWQAVTVASKLVAENGGGVISMSWGDGEISDENDLNKYFTTPGVVYFAASGDSGIGGLIYPAALKNVVSVGGTQFNRNSSTGDFESETYGGGGGGISEYEPIPSYQAIIKKIVGDKRGNPDVSSDFCCTGIYLQGQWGGVGGTSWSSPTFAGIVNAAEGKMKSTDDELTAIYKEYGNKKEYKAEFHDITQGSSYCTVGWNFCGGVGSPRTYQGK